MALVEGYKTVYLCQLNSDCVYRVPSVFPCSDRAVAYLVPTIADRVMRTRKQRRVSRILRVCEERARVRSEYSFTKLLEIIVDRFLHRSHGSGYLIKCVSDAVTVQ